MVLHTNRKGVRGSSSSVNADFGALGAVFECVGEKVDQDPRGKLDVPIDCVSIRGNNRVERYILILGPELNLVDGSREDLVQVGEHTLDGHASTLQATQIEQSVDKDKHTVAGCQTCVCDLARIILRRAA